MLEFCNTFIFVNCPSSDISSVQNEFRSNTFRLLAALKCFLARLSSRSKFFMFLSIPSNIKLIKLLIPHPRASPYLQPNLTAPIQYKDPFNMCVMPSTNFHWITLYRNNCLSWRDNNNNEGLIQRPFFAASLLSLSSAIVILIPFCVVSEIRGLLPFPMMNTFIILNSSYICLNIMQFPSIWENHPQTNRIIS